jgi:hypothetical protein
VDQAVGGLTLFSRFIAGTCVPDLMWAQALYREWREAREIEV